MMTGGEVLVLQHRFTDQVISVPHHSYMDGAHSRYRNWQMKGQGRFIAPPPIFPENRTILPPILEDETHGTIRQPCRSQPMV